jgi:hypothetical protein
MWRLKQGARSIGQHISVPLTELLGSRLCPWDIHFRSTLRCTLGVRFGASSGHQRPLSEARETGARFNRELSTGRAEAP